MAAHLIQAFPATQAHTARFSAQKVWALACSMFRARQTRRMLAEMDHRLLADIGATPSDAHMEAARPFWDFQPRR